MVRADVIYTGEYLRDSHSYNFRKWTIKGIVLSIAQILIFGLIPVILLKAEKSLGKFSSASVIWIILGVIMVPSNISRIVKLLRKGKELEKTLPSEEKREYYFYDDRFIFIKRGTISEVKREFTYKQLYSATETNKYFYIHLQKNLICIIGKNDIVEGNVQELRELFIRNMSDSFVIDTEAKV